MLIDDDHRARLSDFGLASFDRSRWLGATSDSSDLGGTTAYMAPELFHREREEGQSKAPLMRKQADIYALGMLIYEVRLPIVDFCCSTLNPLPGPVREKAIPRCGPAHDQSQSFRWGATWATLIGADSGPGLGNVASMLERGADPEADSRGCHHRAHGPRIAGCNCGVAAKELFQRLQRYQLVPSHRGTNFSASSSGCHLPP